MSEELESPRDRKRKQLFELFSRNLGTVKQHPRIRIEPDLDDRYVCPICMKFFPREALSVSEEYGDYLTLEDVPPKVFGGKVRTLTCKICNNIAGTELESHLANKLDFDEAMQGLKNTSVDGLFRPSKDIKLTATIHIVGTTGIYVEYHPERSHPDHVSQFQSMKDSGSIGTFSLEFLGKYKQHRPEVALLRIAYLLAYSFFGYGFLINFNLMKIRHQIQNPQQRLLPNWGISTMNCPDEALGINIVTKPKELRSFLVVFELKTSSKASRYGVLLPGPTRPGLGIYSWLSELPEDQRNSEMSVVNIPDDDYLRNPELAFASHMFWKELATEE
jgi:hypothetical protein